VARVLVIGSGGREHALAWGLARSAEVDEVVCAPGNPGMAEIGECRAVEACDPAAVLALASEVAPDLVVVGPEDPLAAGVVDPLVANGYLAFGPSAAAARLEGSKAWMKDVLVAAGVPTARYRTFASGDEAAAGAFLDSLPGPYVVKTDGLAAGKGVVVTDSRADAGAAVRAYLSGEAFGDAGRTCVIEEGLVGPELSVFALCDGHDAVFVGAAQDHKRAFDGDEGPNTGGMGAYSPVPAATPELVDEVMHKAIRPTLDEMQRRGATYRGVLFCGLMLTPDGWRVLEYNVRFGDPECQVLVPLLGSDLYRHCVEVAQGRIETEVRLRDEACVAVVMASEGYPPSPLRRTDSITGLDRAEAVEGVEVFHAGTARSGDRLVASGGRVLAVSARAASLAEARDKAYRATAEISWPGVHYRRDIAARALP
jgi:phosphoribosylamine--glycine ligase